MAAVKKWTCHSCNNGAEKASFKNGERWVIQHHPRCETHSNLAEDVGPVTSVNDPNNVLLIQSD